MTRAAWIAIEAGLTAVLSGVREVLAQIQAPAPEPPPPPPPPPAPEPPAPGPVRVEMMDLAKMVVLSPMHDSGSNYDRDLELAVWRDTPVNISAARRDYSGGGAHHRPAQAYTLLVDGRPVAEAQAKEGATRIDWTFNPSGLAPGWHTISVGGLRDGECCPTYFAFRAGGPQPDMIPACTGTYDLTHWQTDKSRVPHVWTMVPRAVTPAVAPLGLASREPVAIGDSVRPEWLAPGDEGNRLWPNATQDGVWSMWTRQAYYWGDAVLAQPRVLLLDGPRGVGTVVMPTHISIGQATREADGGELMGNVYVLDPWRLCRVTDSGHITTLVGWRHRQPSYWDGPQDLELVGDWSRVAGPVGFHEAWGMAWMPETLGVDTGADRIPDEDNRQPHSAGPACLIADSQNNRVLRVEFGARAHGVQPIVTDFITGLADPWDVVAWRDGYIISERHAHRIIEVDRRGHLRRVILQGWPGGTVELQSDPRRIRRVAPLETIRKQACVGPEGLYVLDDWLYWGSYALDRVSRVHLETGEQQVVVDGCTDGNSKFVKLAVSDGTFGPRHAVAVQTWSVSGSISARTLYLPGGGTWMPGRADPWQSTGYGSAVAIGHGRMYTGSSQYGLLRYAKGEAWDRKRYDRGEAEWRAMAGPVLYGQRGYGHTGRALPWGESADVDYYLTVCGHGRPA